MHTILSIPDKRFTVGSELFFGGINGFVPKDYDYVILIDNPTIFKNTMTMRNETEDIFLWRRMSADEFVDITIKLNDPILAGKFLSKEFNDEIGFTLEHLRKLENLFNKIDQKHEYEKVVFGYYMKNNGFYLTTEQLENTFLTYKQNKEKTQCNNARKY